MRGAVGVFTGVSCLGLCLAGCLASTVLADSRPPHWTIPRLDGPVHADGVLSEAQYHEAFSWTNFVETSPRENVPPDYRTRMMLFSTKTALVIAIVCDDPRPEEIRRQRYRRDEAFGSEHVEVFLDPHGEAKQAVYVGVTSANDVVDGLSDSAQGIDIGYDFIFHHGARITSSGWTAEIVIPFCSLSFPRGDRGRFLLSVSRIVPRRDSVLINMLPYRRDSDDPRNGKAYLDLDLTGVQAARTLHFLPSWAGSVHRESDSRQVRRGAGGRAGLTAIWTPRSDTKFKATLHPDFSEVEADGVYQEINNRYPVFIPEKRPFFLEGSESFETPLMLFYSRMMVAPDWGMRVSHRGHRLGLFGMLVHENDVPASRFGIDGEHDGVSWGVARSTVGIGDAGSFIGATATWRRFGESVNSVVAVDGVHQGEHLYVQWQAAWSREGESAFRRRGTGVSIGASYTWNQYLSSSVGFLRLSPEFRADAGFVPWVDERILSATQRFQYEPREHVGFFRSVAASMTVSADHTTEGELVSRDWSVTAEALGPHETSLLCSTRRQKEGFAGVTLPKAWRSACRIDWNEHPSFSPFVSYRRGRSVLYTSAPRLVSDEYRQFGLRSRPGRLSVAVSSTSWRFGSGVSARRQDSWQSDLEFVWNGRLSLSVFATLNKIRLDDLGMKIRQSTMNVLVTYRVNAFSAVYAGANLGSRHDWAPAWMLDDEFENQQVFAKMQWYF